MLIKEITTPAITDPDELASETQKWREAYDHLILRLGQLGTEVEVNRTLETDKDIAPYKFVRDAVHEFIFPPQDSLTKRNKSRVIDPSDRYGLFHENVSCDYDESQVQAHVKVLYDDSESKIAFSIINLRNESELGKDILTAIN